MLQGDFNHMANIITVLFEQIIIKNAEKASSNLNQSSDKSKSYSMPSLF